MRTSVAALGGITILFVGFFALQEAASQAYDPAVINGTNATAETYNTTTAIFDGLGQAAGPAIVWMGVAAVILVSLGLLLVSAQSGR